jgi:hypothetical protein
MNTSYFIANRDWLLYGYDEVVSVRLVLGVMADIRFVLIVVGRNISE